MKKVIVGLLSLLFSVYVAVVTVIFPNISVDAEDPLDPSDFLSAPFIVGNGGPLSIHDVRIECGLIEIVDATYVLFRSGPGKSTVVNPPIETRIMRRGEKKTVSCRSPQFPQPISADISIEISYRPDWWFWSREQAFRFTGWRTADGTLRWAPGALSDRNGE